MNASLNPTAFWFLALLLVSFSVSPSYSADSPATAPTDPDLIRLNFLGDRLTSDETSIAALNKALVMSGYQAAKVGEQADAAQANIKRYDNNGGGPVRWQDFYGKTAKDFVGVHRPNTVFNYVYRAQEGTISQAQQQVAQLGQKTDVLLAERRRRESEQSSLWATIAFTAIENRDISTRALYRYRLADAAMRASDNAPARNPKLDFIRKAVLYVRTLDHTVNVLSDRLDNDQGTAYQALRDTLKGIQTDVQTEGNDFADSGAAQTDVEPVTDIVTQTKAIKEYCQNMCEAYPQAMARDAAGDEKEKLHLRGLLQQSLLGLSAAGVNLDTSIAKLATSWDITPQKGMGSPDAVPEIVLPAGEGQRIAAQEPAQAPPNPAPEAAAPASAATLLPVGTKWLPVDGSAHPGESATVVSVDGTRVALDMRSGNGAVHRWTLEMTEGGHLRVVNDEAVRVPKNAPAVTDIQIEGSVTKTTLILKGNRRRGGVRVDYDSTFNRQDALLPPAADSSAPKSSSTTPAIPTAGPISGDRKMMPASPSSAGAQTVVARPSQPEQPVLPANVGPTDSVAAAAGQSAQDTLAIEPGGGVRLELLPIPSGSFIMGSDGMPNEQPSHKVRITQPFFMGKYLVTQEQWQAMMGSNPSHFAGPKNPVDSVKWSDCQDFAARLTSKCPGYVFKLPTEAQWEYACRAGTTADHYFVGNVQDYAWCFQNAGAMTHPVGQKKPNPWGLYDMTGNVWEWCADWYGPYRDGEASDPGGPDSGTGRAIRGGGWTTGKASVLRSSTRKGVDPDKVNPGIGLRVVCWKTAAPNQ